MICSQCGREIADNALSCPYCGKIFVTKRAKNLEAELAKPDKNNQTKPTSMNQALNAVNQESIAVKRAVSLRRWQRWFFYVVLSGLFLGAVIYIVKLINDNTELVRNLAGVNTQLSKSQQEAVTARQQLAETNQRILQSSSSLEEVRSQLIKTNGSLSESIEENKKLNEQLQVKSEEAGRLTATADKASAALRNLLVEAGVEVAAPVIAKIKLGPLDAYQGIDTDKDGLPDDMEPALGTDPMLGDSDSDGYTDAAELTGGYDPLGKGAALYDAKIADSYKGRFLLQKSANTVYAWYVSSGGLRYFLGSLADDFAAMRNNSYWSRAK